jgi:hypothetical protein
MTKTLLYIVALSFVLSFAFCAHSSAQDAKQPEQKTYTNPEKVDEDYAVQGEYSGEVTSTAGKSTLGVQVIALGDGKFKSAVYTGGLPGSGFDGESIKHYEGKRDGDEVVFDADEAEGTIKDNVLTIATNDGNVIGTLEKVVRESPTLGMEAPDGAIVLFDGQSVDQWKKGKLSEDKLLMQGTTSKREFQSHQLHIEFRLPYSPHARGQARGNSGLYIQGRYEIQMLDSFGLEGKNNECGGIYSIKAPDLNMCYPPLTWQTYDVDFTAAEFDKDGKVIANPKMTVKHNGILVHDDVELPKSTTASPRKPGIEPGPVFLQNHKNPVRYRNIWVVEK